MIVLVALLYAFFFSAPVGADQFEDGLAAHERGDYATTLRLLKPLAEQGNASAQVILGLMYAHGRGVPQFAQAERQEQKPGQDHAQASHGRRRVAAEPDQDRGEAAAQGADGQERQGYALRFPGGGHTALTIHRSRHSLLRRSRCLTHRTARR